MSARSDLYGPSGSPFQHQYAKELESREQHFTTPRVFEMEASQVKIKSLPGGAIWGVVGLPGSPTITSLIRALESKDYSVLDGLARAQLTRFDSFEAIRKLGVGKLSDIPVLADLHYRQRRIAPGLFTTPSLDALISVMPYTGGRLTHEDFQLAQYPLPSREANLECVVVIRPPVLTDIEKQIRDRVPN